MRIKKKHSFLGAVIIASFVLFTGCQQNNEEVETNEVIEEAENVSEANDQEEVEVVELADWDGTWNNMGAYLNDAELEQAFIDLAEREEVSVEEAKTNFVEGGKINFDGLVIEGNKVTLLDSFKDEDGQVLKELEYEYKESRTVKHGNFDTEWFVFESDDDGEYKNLLMMPVHGEEALTHFHLRYGEDLDELLAAEDWYPILVRPNSTYDQLYEEVTE